jgi:putative Holliday junction resolvase
MVRTSSATRIIGIDFGMARIGLAISDERKIIATPLMILTAEKKSEETVFKLLQELQKHQDSQHYTLELIVVGMPLMMSGKKGFLADEVQHFVDLLKKETPIPVITWDERLTTVQAERSMREGHMTRKQRSKVVDTVAAVIILQNYLDHKKITSVDSNS